MKISYLNGEKVYIYPQKWFESYLLSDGEIFICRHRDVVRILNNIFKKAEGNNNRDALTAMDRIMYLFEVYLKTVGNTKDWRLPKEITRERDLDNPGQMKKDKAPPFRTDKRVKMHRVKQLSVIHGGLCSIEPNAHRNGDDGLSDEFRAWLQREHEERHSLPAGSTGCKDTDKQ